MPRRTPAEDRLLARLVAAVVFYGLRAAQRVVAALPARWVLSGADRMGTILYALDHRGRRVGRQNLEIVYGDRLSREERKRILRLSFASTARAIGVLLHAAPLTRERFRRWVDILPEDERRLRDALAEVKGAVVVSGHVGNWEILLGLASLFPHAAPLRFLVEATFSLGVDRFFAYLRGTTGGSSLLREGGARALNAHLRRGGLVGLVVDRNARRQSGGIWAPFFGLEARTTPLPALMARRNDVPIAPVFCVPQEDGRYRILLYPEPSMDVRTDDLRADVLEITTRLNRIMEEVILEHPEAWSWMLKRFKGRPTAERGRYPAYSEHDP